jgi:hypothetical protein
MGGMGITGSAGDLGGACFSAPAASSAGFMGLTEIICVYALGPLGGGGGPGAGSMVGREKARVALSEGRVGGVTAGNFGIGGFRGTGVGKIGGAGAAYDTGWGATKGSLGGAGRTGEGSAAARGSPVDGGAVVLEVREGISGLKNPVNPVPAGSFPAIPDAGRDGSGGGFSGPNMAVKSPTVFRGGSICCEDTAGVSSGLSPRNGP